MDIETKEELGNSTNLVFIDLHSFKKKEEECKSLEDIWMYSIKNMHNLLVCPENVRGTEIEELYLKSELAKMTVEQRKTYEEGIMTRNDILNSIAEQVADARAEAKKIGIAEGLAEGRAEGKAEGKAEGRAEIIRLMHSKGMSAEQISELLETDSAEIERIIGNEGW